jgi:pSer/pThr/pTyr-binding forkhead associated (FHA) protein
MKHNGRFGDFGGFYVPEVLIPALEEIEQAFDRFRDDAFPIQILDKQVSRKHMHICFDENDGQYYVFDMKSKHGVFINGRKIGGEFYMSIGCRGFTSNPLPNSTGDILRVIPTR